MADDNRFETIFVTSAQGDGAEKQAEGIEKVTTAAGEAKKELGGLEQGTESVSKANKSAHLATSAMAAALQGDFVGAARAGAMAMKGFNAAMTVSPLVAFSAILGALTLAWKAYKEATKDAGDESVDNAPKIDVAAQALSRAEGRAKDAKVQMDNFTKSLGEVGDKLERVRKLQDEFLDANVAKQIANVDLAEARKQMTPEAAASQRAGIKAAAEEQKTLNAISKEAVEINRLQQEVKPFEKAEREAAGRAQSARERAARAAGAAARAGIEPGSISASDLEESIASAKAGARSFDPTGRNAQAVAAIPQMQEQLERLREVESAEAGAAEQVAIHEQALKKLNEAQAAAKKLQHEAGDRIKILQKTQEAHTISDAAEQQNIAKAAAEKREKFARDAGGMREKMIADIRKDRGDDKPLPRSRILPHPEGAPSMEQAAKDQTMSARELSAAAALLKTAAPELKAAIQQIVTELKNGSKQIKNARGNQ